MLNCQMHVFLYLIMFLSWRNCQYLTSCVEKNKNIDKIKIKIKICGRGGGYRGGGGLPFTYCKILHKITIGRYYHIMNDNSGVIYSFYLTDLVLFWPIVNGETTKCTSESRV